MMAVELRAISAETGINSNAAQDLVLTTYGMRSVAR